MTAQNYFFVALYGDGFGVERGRASGVAQLSNEEEGAGGEVWKYVPLARADGKGREVKEAGVRRGHCIAVRHGDGDGGSGHLTVGVRCLN